MGHQCPVPQPRPRRTRRTVDTFAPTPDPTLDTNASKTTKQARTQIATPSDTRFSYATEAILPSVFLGNTLPREALERFAPGRPQRGRRPATNSPLQRSCSPSPAEERYPLLDSSPKATRTSTVLTASPPIGSFRLRSSAQVPASLPLLPWPKSSPTPPRHHLCRLGSLPSPTVN